MQDGLGGGDAIHIGHVDVHEHHIWLGFLSHLDGFFAGARSADDGDIRFELKQLADVLSGLGEIVDDEHADGVVRAISHERLRIAWIVLCCGLLLPFLISHRLLLRWKYPRRSLQTRFCAIGQPERDGDVVIVNQVLQRHAVRVYQRGVAGAS